MKLIIPLFCFFAVPVTKGNIRESNYLFKYQENRSDTEKIYLFKAKLTKLSRPTPHCGLYAWAITQKFELLDSSSANQKSKFVLIVQPCPEFMPKGFFKRGRIYNIKASIRNRTTHMVKNNYESLNLPTYWTEDIQIAKD